MYIHVDRPAKMHTYTRSQIHTLSCIHTAKRCIQESGVYEESSQPFLALLYDQFSSLSDEVSCHQVASHIKGINA